MAKKYLLWIIALLFAYSVIATTNVIVSTNLVSIPPSVANISISHTSITDADIVTVKFTCNDDDGLLDLASCKVNLMGEDIVPNIMGILTDYNCTVTISPYISNVGDFVAYPVCVDLSGLESTDGINQTGNFVRPAHSPVFQSGVTELDREGLFNYLVYSFVRFNNTASSLGWSYLWNYSAEDSYPNISMSVWGGGMCGVGDLRNESVTSNLYWNADIGSGKFQNDTVCMNYTSALETSNSKFQSASPVSNLTHQYVGLNVTITNLGAKSGINYSLPHMCPGYRLSWLSEACSPLNGQVGGLATTSEAWYWAESNLTPSFSAWHQNTSYPTTITSQRIYRGLNITNTGGLDLVNVAINIDSPLPGSCNLCSVQVSVPSSGYSGLPFWDEGDGVTVTETVPSIPFEPLTVSTTNTWYYWNMTLDFDSVMNFSNVYYNWYKSGISDGFLSGYCGDRNWTGYTDITPTSSEWLCFRTKGPKILFWTTATATLGGNAELVTIQVNPDNVDWDFVNATYRNIRVSRTTSHSHQNWYLFYYNESNLYQDVTFDPSYAFEGSGNNVTFLIPNVHHTKTESKLVYYKIEGVTPPPPPGSGDAGGGGGALPSPHVGGAVCLNNICEVGEDIACPTPDLFKDCDGYCDYWDDPDNPFRDQLGSPDCPTDIPPTDMLKVVFEISPRTIDPVVGVKPAPFQSIGSTCRTYRVKNIGSAAGYVELEIGGNVYSVPGIGSAHSSQWVTIDWINQSQYLLIGETREVQICVSYPDGADETYKAFVKGTAFGHTETIDIFIQPPLFTQLLKFFLKPSSIAGLSIIILMCAGVISFFVLTKRKRKPMRWLFS